MSLIEIGIRQALAAGAGRVVIVTGHEAELLEREIGAIARRCDADIGCIRLDDWSRPNGWSVIAGAQGMTGPFLLMMADHLFGDGLLARLARAELGARDVVLATDRVDNPLVDPEDATWVAFDEHGGIGRIGKHIEPFDAVDCGAFLATPALPAAIETAIARGKAGSLSNGMQVLAEAGRAGAMDIEGAWWIDVDDPRAHDLACAQAAMHIAILEGAGADAC